MIDIQEQYLKVCGSQRAWILGASDIVPVRAGAGMDMDGSKKTTCGSGLKSGRVKVHNPARPTPPGKAEIRGWNDLLDVSQAGGCRAKQEKAGGGRAGDGLLAAGCEVCSQAELPDLVNSRKPCLVN